MRACAGTIGPVLFTALASLSSPGHLSAAMVPFLVASLLMIAASRVAYSLPRRGQDPDATPSTTTTASCEKKLSLEDALTAPLL